MIKRQVLGKGLRALIPETSKDTTVMEIAIDQIKPGKYQPRSQFDPEKEKELVASIKEKGLIQPIVVRPISADNYEVVAGERRFRAAISCGFKTIPVVIKEISDREALEVSIIENIQREGLNPIEEALAYQRLVNEFGVTQDAIAHAVSKSRATITNTLRLLKLSPEIQIHLKQGEFSAGHARAILSIPSPLKQKDLCNQILKKGMSVRDAEMLANHWIKGESNVSRETSSQEDPWITACEERLQERFGTKVKIYPIAKDKGRIIVEYYSLDDLSRIMESIAQPN